MLLVDMFMDVYVTILNVERDLTQAYKTVIVKCVCKKNNAILINKNVLHLYKDNL